MSSTVHSGLFRRPLIYEYNYCIREECSPLPRQGGGDYEGDAFPAFAFCRVLVYSELTIPPHPALRAAFSLMEKASEAIPSP